MPNLLPALLGTSPFFIVLALFILAGPQRRRREQMALAIEEAEARAAINWIGGLPARLAAGLVWRP